MRSLRVLALCAVASLGCNGASPPVAAPQERAEPSRACHPIVSGCGCAYQCARGTNETSPGRWQVTHDELDGAMVDAVLQQWCFDDEGRGFAAHTINTPPPRDRRCLPAFFDLSACGGECIPATSYLGCHTVGDDCVP